MHRVALIWSMISLLFSPFVKGSWSHGGKNWTISHGFESRRSLPGNVFNECFETAVDVITERELGGRLDTKLSHFTFDVNGHVLLHRKFAWRPSVFHQLWPLWIDNALFSHRLTESTK